MSTSGVRAFFECSQISDIALHEPEVGMPVEVDTGVAGVLREVENRDGVAAVQQCGHQVRSDEAVAACHDDIGHSCSFISVWVDESPISRLSADPLVDEAGGAHGRRVEAVASVEEHAPGLPSGPRAGSAGSGGTLGAPRGPPRHRHP